MRAAPYSLGLSAVLIGALGAGCTSATGPAHPSPFPGAATPRATVTSPADAPEPAVSRPTPRGVVLETALSLRGVPYREGGVDPVRGFDCSGFVQYVFQLHRIALPRTVAQQYARGLRIRPNDIAAGDLIFFTTVRPGASHVGIAIGDGTFVHAPISGGVIRIDRLDAPYWRARLVGATRVMEAP